MRTIVDIPKETIESLDALGSKEKKSRAALIRDAVDAYLTNKSQTLEDSGAFGIWNQRKQDGVDYQTTLRDEWE